MKKLIIGLCAALAAAVGLADMNVNLTKDVRAKKTAGLCGDPTITGAGHANYSYKNAFDGISISGDNYRWLSANDNNPASAWAQYVAPTDYATGAAFALSGYRVHRLFNKGSFDLARSPKKWEILGVLPDGTTEPVLTNSCTWGSADTDEVRIRTFSANSSYRYRGFRFHPLETSSNDGVRFGLLEVEFIVSWQGSTDDDSLTVSATFLDAQGVFSPAIGTTVREDTTCTAPIQIYHDGLPYDLKGYTLEKWENSAWTGGDVTNAASTYAYSMATKGVYRLTWCYATEAYNLVPTMRAEGIEPTFDGKTAGADWPVANVFDGFTHAAYPTGTSGMKLRWLCKKADGPYVQVTVGDIYRAGYAIRPVAYRIWRLYDDNQGYERSPTSWTLTGVRTEDSAEVTLDTVTDWSWSKGTTDGDRTKMTTLQSIPAGNFRSFKFTPTATQEKNDYTGLFELEIFVKDVEIVANSLTVASANGVELSCTPSVGKDLTQAGTCTRTSKGYLGTSRLAPAGYKLFQLQDSTWVEIASDPTSDTYEWDGTGGNLMLEWQWGAADGYKVDVTSYGQESFTFSPALDARGFYDAGAQVTVTPVAQTDPASSFKAWVGDVPAGSETTSPLVLTVDGYKAIRGEFTRAWKFIPDTAEAKAGTFTDGNWRYHAEKDMFEPVGDYVPDLLLPANAYLAGQGLLDMSTLPTDTGRRLTLVRAKASNNRPEITGLILPPGLARLGKETFNGCVNLAFVEMPDSVLQCDSGDSSDGNGGAFGGCTALTRVQLSNGLVSLGHQTFGSCANLETVTPFLPQTLTYLGSAFQNCTKLAGTPNLNSVETLENGCFVNCTGIVGDYDLTGKTLLASKGGNGPFAGTRITSARGVSALPSKLFYQNTAITNVSCAAGITSIEERTFAACEALRDISVADDFVAITNIGLSALASLRNVTLPQNWPSVTHIDGSFWNCWLRSGQKLVFPKIQWLGNGSFQGIMAESVDLRGSTITSVPKEAFSRFADSVSAYGYLKEAILPESVTELGQYAFRSWGNGMAYAIRFCGLPPTTIDELAFASCDTYKQFYIYVPQDAEKLAAWKAHADFVALADIADVETKSGWDLIKDNKRLIGTWRQKWCLTWNSNPKGGLVISVK